MDNEVVIKVSVDDASAPGMGSARRSIIAGAKKAGDEGGKILGDALIRGADGRLRDSRGRFASLGDSIGKGAGPKAGTVIADGIMSGLLNVSKLSTPILVGMGIGAAPGIGAAISAGIIGGAGGLGIIGGVALAARSPQVKSAGTSLGQTLMSGLEVDSGAFVAPVLRSIDMIEDRFEGLRPTIAKIFGNSSKFLEPMVDSATRAVGSILNGIERLTSKGGPVMDSLGRSVEIVGVAFEKAAGIIAGGSGDAANATDQMAESLGSMIVIAAGVIRGLTKVGSVIVDINTQINDAATFLPKFFGWMDKGGESAANAAPPIQEVGQAILSSGEAAGEAGRAMSTYGNRMADAADKGGGFFDSQTNVAKSIRAAKKALDDNGKGLSTNTDKQLENRDAISRVARALQAEYSAFVKVNGEGAAASRVAESNRSRFTSLARQFGLTARQANNLADQMGFIKDKKIAFYANTHDAAGRISALKSQIASVKGKTVYINVKKNYDSSSPGDAFAHGGIVGGAAAGGARSGLTMVGEYGPELLQLPPGTRVNSNADTERMLGQGGGGVVTVRAVADRTTERGLIDALFRVIRWEVANSYGGDPIAAFGR
jgi:hypothetical protein